MPLRPIHLIQPHYILLALSLFLAPPTLYVFIKNISSTITIKYLFLTPIKINLPIIIDSTSIIFAVLILFIAGNVLQFSTTYIATDKFTTRFSLITLLFVLSIITLIFTKRLIFILIGWDGLGFSSFLLVIYYQNNNSLSAGIATALTNRIGDTLILISIALLLTRGHWIITRSPPTHNKDLISLLIVTAALTKRAQIPFSSWLPAAIAAPTPVSALVHSSTLVTAGVFLLIRFYPSISPSPLFQPLLLIVASATIVIAGIRAMFECDIKKIIALSTLSQLGLIIATIALGLPTLATFHLFTHALFKALLFISAGTIIHFASHSQDLRLIGNTPQQLPITTSCMFIANTALCGAPFFAGFFSKDLILEITLSSPTNLLIVLIFFFATLLTTTYSTRFLLILLWPSISIPPLHPTNDENLSLTTPQLRLTSVIILFGAFASWSLIPITPHPTLPLWIKTLPLITTLLGAFGAWYTLHLGPQIPPKKTTTSPYFSIWFLKPLTTQNTLVPLIYAPNISNLIDHGWLNTILRKGPFLLLTSFAALLQHLQATTINAFLLRATILSSLLLLLF